MRAAIEGIEIFIAGDILFEEAAFQGIPAIASPLDNFKKDLVILANKWSKKEMDDQKTRQLSVFKNIAKSRQLLESGKTTEGARLLMETDQLTFEFPYFSLKIAALKSIKVKKY